MIQAQRVLKALKDFRELIALLAFYASFLAKPLSPDLTVNYEMMQLLLPSFATPTSTGTPPLEGKTPASILLITITNSSKDEIKDLEVSVVGIAQIDAAALRSTSPIMERDAAELAKYQEHSEGTYIFPNLKSIPPAQTVTIQIAGRFFDLLLADRVTVASSARKKWQEESRHVSGLFAFLDAQKSIIYAFLLIAAVATGAYRLRGLVLKE